MGPRAALGPFHHIGTVGPSPSNAFIAAAFDVKPPGAITHIRPTYRDRGLTTTLLAFRSGSEASANALLAHTPLPEGDDVASLEAQLDAMTSFSIFSLLHCINRKQPDWQVRSVMFRTPHGGVSSVQWSPCYTRRRCTDITAEQLNAILKAGGNYFGGAQLTDFAPNPLCLPPASKLSVGENTLTIENPFVRMIVKAQAAGGNFVQLEAAIVYSALRIHHPDMPEYKAWVARVISDAQEWFGVEQ